MYVLTEIWVYPVKSLGGIRLQEALTERRGLQYDRRWMLVDRSGRFVSQREIPAMALLGTAIAPPFLQVFQKNNPSERVEIPLEMPSANAPKIMVDIWDDRCSARVSDEQINRWFSRQLGQDLRLVYMPDTTRRRADGRYAPKGQYVSFADGFPYLIIGQASLDELNRRMPRALPMDRFRPNFVFEGGEPFEEDNWQDFRIENVPFCGVKPCARCIIPTTNQQTAERAAEPLKTLSTFRKFGNRILFGQNVIWNGATPGKVRVGFPIHKLSTHAVTPGS
jgi:uncharacterized protein YcbX